jgi:hypothetical protein
MRQHHFEEAREPLRSDLHTLRLHRAIYSTGDPYVLEGCKWPNFAPQINITLGTTQPYAYVAAVAANDWNTGFTNHKTFFSYTTSPSTGTQGPVYEHAQSLGATGFDGITYYSCSGGFFSGSVSVYYNTYYTGSYNGSQDEDLIGHEEGHALGLAHSNTGAACSSIAEMYYISTQEYTSCGYIGPRADDLNGADNTYGAA